MSKLGKRHLAGTETAHAQRAMSCSRDRAFESSEAYESLLGGLTGDELNAVAGEAVNGNMRRYIWPPLHAAAVPGMIEGTLGLEETLERYFLWWKYDEYLQRTIYCIHDTDTCLDLAMNRKAKNEMDAFEKRAYAVVDGLFDSTPEDVLRVLFCSVQTVVLVAKFADKRDHALHLFCRPVAFSLLQRPLGSEEAKRRAELWRLYLFYLKAVKHSQHFVPPEPEEYSKFFDYRKQLYKEAAFARKQFRTFCILVDPHARVREFYEAWATCKRAFGLL